MTFEHQFKDKVIALTGAASGMGLATTQVLASRGAKLSLADVQAQTLEKVKSDILSKHPDAEVLVFTVDVRQYSQVEEWIKQTKSQFGRIDGTANLAGVIGNSIGTGELENQDFDEWKFLIDVNLTGIMHCLRAQIPELSDGGAIVNAASLAAIQGRANNGAYSASKHGVLGLTRSAAKEVGIRGIRVNAICPGVILTSMVEHVRALAKQKGVGANYEQSTVANVALRREGKPEEVARLVAFLLSDESTYISGNAVSIDGGWNC